MIVSCIAAPSPNFDQRGPATPVDILVMHYTGMETGAGAIARLTDAASKVSSHYTVDEDGTIYSHVPEDCRAWHAGKSYWAGATDINARSVGIEIVNPGHEFGYRSFPDAQIEAVMELSLDILSRHAIPPERVLGHSDVAPARKQDPGELFPWAKLAKAGIGLWRAPLRLTPSREGRGNHTRTPSPPAAAGRGEGLVTRDAAFEQNLRAYGYGIRPDVEVSLEDVITAFQRHFRQDNVNGIADEECETILQSLLTHLDDR